MFIPLNRSSDYAPSGSGRNGSLADDGFRRPGARDLLSDPLFDDQGGQGCLYYIYNVSYLAFRKYFKREVNERNNISQMAILLAVIALAD